MNNQNPSQEEPKRGVFDSIQGAKSRDTEVAEEPVKEPEKAEPTEAAQEPTEAAKEKPGDERLGKALQRVAQLERKINQDYAPWAQFGMAVASVKGKGEDLVKRYQQGQALFVDEEGEVSTEPSTPNQQPLTEQGINDLLDQREATRRVMGDLTSMAEEELPNFKKISRSQDFAEMLEWARQSVWKGGIPMDESVADWDNEFAAKEYTAIKKAYKMKVASDPRILEATKNAAKKEQQERDAEAAAVPSPTGTSTTTSQEEPGEKTEAEEAVDRMLKAHGTGKSFASIGSKR